jgi:hypothetical protein
MPRRVLCAISWLLLLNVNVEAADRACASHPAGQEVTTGHGREHDRTASHHAERDYHDATRVHEAAHEDHDDGDCQSPRVAKCCQVAASCGITLAAEEKDCALIPHDDRHVVADTLGGALKGLRAPETPPPKA